MLFFPCYPARWRFFACGSCYVWMSYVHTSQSPRPHNSRVLAAFVRAVGDRVQWRLIAPPPCRIPTPYLHRAKTGGIHQISLTPAHCQILCLSKGGHKILRLLHSLCVMNKKSFSFLMRKRNF